MAPKLALGNIKKTLEGVAKQVQRLQSLQGKATSGLANWDCAFCPQGHNNFAHRTFCYKCSRDRTSGEVVGGAAVRQAAQGSIQGARARSRPARGQSSAPPPKAPDTEQAQSQEDDPIAIELAAARSYVEWVRKQKQVIRDKELPQAQKRLSEAEAKDKQRKPPAERLQSALSRVDHRQRLADQAREAASKAQEAATKAKEEAEAAETLLKEAKQELQVAQAVHRAWGPSSRAASPTGEGPVYTPQAPFSGASGLSAQQLEVLQQISEGYAPGSPHSELLLGLLKGAAAQGPVPPPGPQQGPAKKAKVDPASVPKAQRSRTRDKEEQGSARPPSAGEQPVEEPGSTAGDAVMDPEV